MAGRKIAILFADEPTRRYLAEVSAASTRGYHRDCRVSFLVHSRIKSRVVMIVYQGAVEFIGGVEGVSRADDIRWTFDLRSLAGLDRPLELNRLRAVLRVTQQRPLDEQGELTELASQSALDVLVDHQRSLGPLLDILFAARTANLTVDRQIKLAQERDAIASAFAFTGFPGLLPDEGLLTDSEVANLSNRESFLPEVQQGTPLEDPMVEHDANTFLGWRPGRSDKLGVRVFTDGVDRRLHVMSVNRWAIETRLGPDLIYYHVQRRSFVIVQYKRMVLDYGTWRYRVNDHFREQLRAMRELDDQCNRLGIGGDFRLLPTPSFVKICRLETLDIDNLSMVSGMCMPRQQVEMHLARPGSSQSFDYETVRDYMTSTLFAQLVAHGYVGTAGASSDLVKQEIDNALNRRGSALIGAFSNESGRRPSWHSGSVRNDERAAAIPMLE